jgi:hypothetical protein
MSAMILFVGTCYLCFSTCYSYTLAWTIRVCPLFSEGPNLLCLCEQRFVEMFTTDYAGLMMSPVEGICEAVFCCSKIYFVDMCNM